jgi:DNA-binding response OmpR family regulator
MNLFRLALLVEDEPNLALTLQVALKKLGIQVRHVTTLKAAKEAMDFSQPENLADFILLDRMLPDGDGLELCSSLRADGYQGMILILTAKSDPVDRASGLNVGADDYLPKPFTWEELDARVRALSRRKQPIAITPWACDESRQRISGPNGWVDLTALEFKLASRLIRAQGAIVTREDLLKNVWGFKFLPKTRTVDHFLGRLRKRFETNPEDPQHFITVRGSGYRFEP